MNNTKWNEIFWAFYWYECDEKGRARWKTRDVENGYIYGWEPSWTHFGCEPKEYDKIDYLQIELTDDNRDFVIQTLKDIHVPGILEDDVVTIYGYRQDVDYI